MFYCDLAEAYEAYSNRLDRKHSFGNVFMKVLCNVAVVDKCIKLTCCRRH